MPERTVIHGRYELEPVHLGRGGMGTVWEGRDTVLDRRVAVKLIRFPDDYPDRELERRFEREARIMARLNHPGVPAIYDLGVFDDESGRRHFIVMEFIEGVGLHDIIPEHESLPIGWAAAIGAQVAAVLSAIHELSILHRDLKPSNLMVRSDGTVKVVDFGLGLLRDPAVSQLTQTGQVLGTPAYMPPEQIHAATLTPRSDLYALGCVLFEMLAGRPPFIGTSEFSVKEQHIHAAPPAVRAFRPDAPPELDELIRSLLAKRPEDRPESAAVVHDRLLPYVTEVDHLPGVTHAGASPVRMYANAVSRILVSRGEAAAERPASPVAAGGPRREDLDRVRGEDVDRVRREDLDRVRHEDLDRVHREDLDRVRREAVSLVRESRYGQADELLGTTIEKAAQAFGADDPEVLDLRLHRANVLFDGGDYRAAAHAFRDLAADLAWRFGPGDERVLRCRLREADCHAYLGEDAHALRLLRELLDERSGSLPSDDRLLTELRRRIGELAQSVGDAEVAASPHAG